MDRAAARVGETVSFNREARKRFLEFAGSPGAEWRSNFRDLNAAVIRMATLAAGGRITLERVEEEIGRLESQWKRPEARPGGDLVEEVLGPRAAEIDLFDQAQLAVVFRVCRECPSLSEAGRRLFSASRRLKKSANDADRLSKYLARFGIVWDDLRFGRSGGASSKFS